jgi:hypothetical protein
VLSGRISEELGTLPEVPLEFAAVNQQLEAMTAAPGKTVFIVRFAVGRFFVFKGLALAA